MPIRSYPEMESIMRRIETIVHKYLPDYTVEIAHPKTMPWAGINLTRKLVIRFNRDLIAQAPWEEIEGVVLHEIAHTFQDSNVEHSKDWQNITKSLGGIAKSGYPFSYTSRQPRFLYRCATCGLEFESVYLGDWQGTRISGEPLSHPLTHGYFYIMDAITREKFMVER